MTTVFLGGELALEIVNDEVDSSLRMAAIDKVSGQHWRIDLVSDSDSEVTGIPSCTGNI